VYSALIVQRFRRRNNGTESDQGVERLPFKFPKLISEAALPKVFSNNPKLAFVKSQELRQSGKILLEYG
jgi:hypothetical protein